MPPAGEGWVGGLAGGARARKRPKMMQLTCARALFPKFVDHRGAPCTKAKGTSKAMVPVPLFDLKVLLWTRDNPCRTFKSAALVRSAFFK
jgi:hypothetical protein